MFLIRIKHFCASRKSTVVFIEVFHISSHQQNAGDKPKNKLAYFKSVKIIGCAQTWPLTNLFAHKSFS